ncbi:MAG: hypothetical protein FWD59_08130 [Micrococcales bacterium]|nr:hypothetical protein [Micrococcales bacterium]
MRFGIADSALKRSDVISYGDIMHVARNGDLLGADADGLLWRIGTSPTGLDVELAALTTREGDALIIIHAFPMDWRRR